MPTTVSPAARAMPRLPEAPDKGSQPVSLPDVSLPPVVAEPVELAAGFIAPVVAQVVDAVEAVLPADTTLPALPAPLPAAPPAVSIPLLP